MLNVRNNYLKILSTTKRKDITKYSMKLILILYPIFLLISCHTDIEQTEQSESKLRIVSYNVWYGFTKVAERKEHWIEWMKNQNPDIVSLQELNGYTADKLKEDAKIWDHSFSDILKEDGFPTGVTSRYPYVFTSSDLVEYVHRTSIIADQSTLILSDHLPVMVDLIYK
jgi:endonuclease/exonuclease/phosphatase family metal-dependent hydrolase